jgi:alpha-amylase
MIITKEFFKMKVCVLKKIRTFLPAALLLLAASCAVVSNPIGGETATNMEGESTSVYFDGSRTDVMLQGFHWESHEINLWNMLKSKAGEINDHFDIVYIPPPSRALSDEGYLPLNLYDYESGYGDQNNGATGQFKDMLSEMRSKGVKVVADIVVNHNLNVGYDFLTNNDGGYGGWDDGANYGAAPDMAHVNSNVRNYVKGWLSSLRNLNGAGNGIDGWRWDFVKGFHASHIANYNNHTNPYISIMEYWPEGDWDRYTLRDKVEEADNRSMIFDFELKKRINSAFWSSGNFYGSALGDANRAYGSDGLIGIRSDAAVTFVDNHDTGIAPWGQNHGNWHTPAPCSGNIYKWSGYDKWKSSNGHLISTYASYALILTHPGIPCVFWSDWYDRDSDMKYVIEELIRIRKANNVHRTSRHYVARAENGLYAAYIGDEGNEQVAIKIGKQGWGNYEGWYPSNTGGSGWSHSLHRYVKGGHAFQVYFKNKTW